MIDRRLIGIVPGSMRYVGASVALQWASLLANMGMVLIICRTLSVLWAGMADEKDLALLAACVVVVAAVRAVAAMGSARMRFLASREVKRTLRHRIYEKLLRLGQIVLAYVWMFHILYFCFGVKTRRVPAEA